MYEVEGTDEFVEWFDGLDENDRARVEDRVDQLVEHGPALGRPVVDTIKGSKHKNMKELRTGSIRVLFIFDPHSTAILLLGGSKKNNWTGWYEENIPAADALYDLYLEELAAEERAAATDDHDQDQEVQRDPGTQAHQRRGTR